jgi:PucR family transcriptional regulator, purine catabolism regulatory protein
VSLILREVLDHALLRPADPVLRSGADNLDRTVRWVHSADLVDIAPLLRGGEVLLTNGVGLVSVDPSARRSYVRSLAEIGVAALLFEVGRGFTQVPDEMVDEARAANLTIVELQPALRFTEVAETVNSELIDRSVVRLRHADETSRALSVALARGASLQELIKQVAATLGTWAELRDHAGHLVAGAGAMHTDEAERADAPVLVDGTAWGRLVIGTAGSPASLNEAVLDRAPTVLGLCLIREHRDVASALRTQQLLLEQLVGNRRVPRALLTARLEAAGVAVTDHDYVCLAVEPHRIQGAAQFVDGVLRECGHGVFGFVHGVLCAVIARPRGDGRSTLGDAARRAATTGVGREKRVCVVIGRTVRDVGELPRAMADAHSTLALGQELHVSEPVIGVQELALQRLLGETADREALRHFVDEQIGVLDESDRTRGGQLIHTLEVLTACAGSKVEAARRLHIRRQSLYYRLEQIERLTGANLDDPQQLLPVTVALTVRQMLAASR